MDELVLLKIAADQYSCCLETGVFTHEKCYHKSKIGKRAGCWVKDEQKNHTNYYNILGITVEGKKRQIKAHRLAWFMHYGELPPKVIDHIEHATRKDDSLNRISNLRDGSKGINQKNIAIQTASEHTGVYEDRGKWRSRVKVGKKLIYLGTFSCEQFASAVYQDAVFMLEKSGLDGVMEVKKRWVNK